MRDNRDIYHNRNSKDVLFEVDTPFETLVYKRLLDNKSDFKTTHKWY